MKICSLSCLALLAACSQPPPVSSSGASIATGAECPVFGKVDLSEAPASDRAVLEAASADYCAVLAGRSPIHAMLNASFKRTYNGSTARYIGDGYSLLDVRDVRFIGGVPVGVFGPVLKLDDRLSDGGLEVSQLRLVSIPDQH